MANRGRNKNRTKARKERQQLEAETAAKAQRKADARRPHKPASLGMIMGLMAAQGLLK